MYSEEDLLPISGLQHVCFCERRWALVHLERQWEENLFTTQGELLHEKAHSAKIESRPGALIRRTLPLCSFRLGLSGQADVVEFFPSTDGTQGTRVPSRSGLWTPYPIEYKRSRDKRGSIAYRVQLCAQAMCLEEMLATPVPAGAVYDGLQRRRHEVEFDSTLRETVEAVAARMHQLFRAGVTPPPVYEKKCDSCSLQPLCLPAAGSRNASEYIRRAVAANLRVARGVENE